MKKNQHIQNFISHLQALAKANDRAALAALRRAWSGEQRDIIGTFRYVGRHLPPYRQAQDNYVLIAALFAHHPQSCEEGNMGTHFAALRAANPKREQALERRFSAMLRAHPDDLPHHLRTAVDLLKSNEVPIPVNWYQLLWDVRRWGHPEHFVQRHWATAFWGRTTDDK
jgi:CRISPR system Cascade subunit CasB